MTKQTFINGFKYNVKCPHCEYYCEGEERTVTSRLKLHLKAKHKKPLLKSNKCYELDESKFDPLVKPKEVIRRSDKELEKYYK